MNSNSDNGLLTAIDQTIDALTDYGMHPTGILLGAVVFDWFHKEIGDRWGNHFNPHSKQVEYRGLAVHYTTIDLMHAEVLVQVEEASDYHFAIRERILPLREYVHHRFDAMMFEKLKTDESATK